MDGICYSCQINPQGQSFASIVKILGKDKILYKTHVQAAGEFTLMGTLAPRLNVDNGVHVYDGQLKEVSVLLYEKLMRMEVLHEFQRQFDCVSTKTESTGITFDSAADSSSKSVYIPPGKRALQ